MNATSLVTNFLENRYQRRVLLTGSGTMSIYLYLCFLKQHDSQRSSVIIPSNSCMNLYVAVRCAGLQPVFCDVNLSDGNIDFTSVSQFISDSTILALIITNIYGNRDPNTKGIVELCKTNNIHCIDDAAQCFFTDREGTYASTCGDVGILSFGSAKQISIRQGGALLVSDGETYLELQSLLHSFELRARSWSNTFSKYLYAWINHSDYPNWMKMPLLKKIASYAIDFRCSPLFDSSKSDILYKKLTASNILMHYLIDLREIYMSLFNMENGFRPLINAGSIPWRFSFLVPGNTARIAKKIRKQGINVSRLYPSMGGCKCKNSLLIQDRVINLWLDDNVNSKNIINAYNVIQAELAGNN